MSSEENLKDERRHGFGDLPDDILIERGEVQSGELYRPVNPTIAPDVRNYPDMSGQSTGENLKAYPLKVSSVFDTLPINAQPFLTAGDMTQVFDPSSGYVWASRISAADNNWSDVTWSPELNLFVAVSNTGVGNRVMTSPDGVNWTIRASAADNSWQSIAWSPSLGLFAAVAASGVGNRVMTSPDGVNWTIRASAADNAWTAIEWSPSLGLFAAVATSGVGNRVMTSPDGVNWTIRASAADSTWYGLAWSPSLALFVATAIAGVIGNRIMTSPDGVNWTSHAAASTNQWYSVAWSPSLNLFAAVAANGAGNSVMTSPDGVTWTSQVTANDGNSWMAISWSPGLALFVAVASGVSVGDRVMTSPDGVIWTKRVSAADNAWQSVAWSPSLGLFAAVSTSGVSNRVMTSSSATGYLTLNYTIPKSYVGIIQKFKIDISNIAIGAGDYLFSLLINNSVIPNFNSIPYRQLLGEFVNTNIIAPPDSTITVKLNVSNSLLLRGNAVISGALLLSRGYPTNYEIGSE